MKTQLTPEEDREWVELFNYYSFEEGLSDDEADKKAWEELVKQFPRLANYDGCLP